jgi:hypothetical protein
MSAEMIAASAFLESTSPSACACADPVRTEEKRREEKRREELA